MGDWLRKALPLLLAAVGGAIVAVAIGSYLSISGPAQGIGGVAGGVAGAALRFLLFEQRVRLEHQYRVIEEQTKTVHKYAVAYYLPYIVRAQGFAATLVRSPLSNEECMYALAHLYSIGRKWLDETPVLLLKDRVGENVIQSIERRFLNVVGQPFNKEDKAELIKQTSLGELYVDWVNKIKPGGSLHKIFSQKFRPWIRKKTNRDELVRCLNTFARLFLFEINTCYSSWYGKSPTKVTMGTGKIDSDLVKNCLNDLLSNGDIDENDYKSYLRKLGIK